METSLPTGETGKGFEGNLGNRFLHESIIELVARQLTVQTVAAVAGFAKYGEAAERAADSGRVHAARTLRT